MSSPCRSPRPFTTTAASSGSAVVPIYGGQPIGRQLRSLEAGVDVVVATPGRALDHLRRRTLRLASLQVMVLDEADEMLDMGFAEDLEAIFAETPPSRQTVLFSATLPKRIDAIARKHLRDPARIRIIDEVRAAKSRPGYGTPPTSSNAPTRRPPSGGSSTSSRRPRHSSSAEPARQSTASPRRSTAAATAPRPCTAG